MRLASFKMASANPMRNKVTVVIGITGDIEMNRGAENFFTVRLNRGNLTGVFDIPKPEEVKGKNVLLCDDISTSGETFNECAKMLWLADAAEICCISLAVTKRDKNKK